MDGDNYSAGIGYVALPTDIERDTYINLCYRTSTICMRTEDGAFFKLLPIDKLAFNFIEFPAKPSELGSAVVYVNEPIKNQLIIISVLSSPQEVQDNVEGQFKFKKLWGQSYVEIVGSAKQKYLGLTVNTSDETGGEAYIKVSNKNRDAKLTFEVTGDINMVSSNSTNISSFNKTLLLTTDANNENSKSLFEQTPTKNFFDGERFEINKGDQAMVRGDKIKQLLSDFFTDLSSAQVTTPAGPGTFDPSFTTKVAQYISKLEEILSTKSFLE